MSLSRFWEAYGKNETWLPCSRCRIKYGSRRDTEDLYDGDSNQVFLICRSGQLATLPDCPKCVKIIQLQSSPAEDGWFDNECIVVRFADGSAQVLKSDAIQYRVSLSYAYQCLAQGGSLIDLRTCEEYAAGHLRGSIHIPFDRLGEHLRNSTPLKPSSLCAVSALRRQAVLYARRCGYSKHTVGRNKCAFTHRLSGYEDRSEKQRFLCGTEVGQKDRSLVRMVSRHDTEFEEKQPPYICNYICEVAFCFKPAAENACLLAAVDTEPVLVSVSMYRQIRDPGPLHCFKHTEEHKTIGRYC